MVIPAPACLSSCAHTESSLCPLQYISTFAGCPVRLLLHLLSHLVVRVVRSPVVVPSRAEMKEGGCDLSPQNFFGSHGCLGECAPCVTCPCVRSRVDTGSLVPQLHSVVRYAFRCEKHNSSLLSCDDYGSGYRVDPRQSSSVTLHSYYGLIHSPA